MTDDQELVCVHICQGWDLAQVFKSSLETAGIPVLLKYDSASRVFGLTVDGLGQVRIMVPRQYASDAEELLKGSDNLHRDQFDAAPERNDEI